MSTVNWLFYVTKLGVVYYVAISDSNSILGGEVHIGSLLSLECSSVYHHPLILALNITSLETSPLTTKVSLFICLRAPCSSPSELLLTVSNSLIFQSLSSMILLAFEEQEPLFTCSLSIGYALCVHHKGLGNICWIDKRLWVQYCSVLVTKKSLKVNWSDLGRGSVTCKQYAFTEHLFLLALI